MRRTLCLAIILMALAGCGRKTPLKWVERPAPEPPSELRAFVRPEGVRLSWAALSGLTYVIERSDNGAQFKEIGRLGGGSYTADLTDLGRVHYRVRPLDAKTNKPSKPSPAVLIEGRAGLQRPAAPSATVRLGEVLIAPATEGMFNVYTSASDLIPLNPEPLTLGRAYTVPAEASGELSFVLREVVSSRQEVITEGPASEAVVLGADAYVPDMPSHPDAIYTNGRVLVFWNPSPEPWIRGYRVYRADNDGEFRLLAETRSPAYTDDPPKSGLRGVRYKASALGPVKEGPMTASIRVSGSFE